uniref:Superkiller complex protein 8 n=2 Tax=Neognathae TaxID=8825 RepID=A0A803YED5_MELGA
GRCAVTVRARGAALSGTTWRRSVVEAWKKAAGWALLPRSLWCVTSSVCDGGDSRGDRKLCAWVRHGTVTARRDGGECGSDRVREGRTGAFLLRSLPLRHDHTAHDDAIWSVAWGKNKKDGSETVISGSLDDLVKVWKWNDEKLDLQWTLEGHQLGVVSVDISHTGSIAASSSLDAHIRLWDLETGKQIKSIDAGPVDAWSLAFSPDSQFLATGSHVGKVNIFGVETGKKEYSLDTRGKFILSIAYSPDGKYLASGAIDGIINIFDIATGKLLHTLEGHAMPIRSLTFSPDSQLLVTASDDGYIKIYDVQHANLAGTLSGHGSWVLNVAFCPDDTHFVSSSSDKSVKVWDAGTRTCVHTFFDHQDQVWGVKYNGSGSKIVSVGDDQEIHIYDCPV